MRIHAVDFGPCELVIHVDAHSAIDSYLLSGYSEFLGRELTDQELDKLQTLYSDLIQVYSYQNGSRNHN